MAVKDDIRKFELEINAASKNGETLAQITKLGKETAKLRTENEQLEKTLGFLRTRGQQNTEEYKRMSKQLKENKAAIRENGIAMKGLQKSLDNTQLSMNQLREKSRNLKSALSATVKAANPDEYARLEKELKDVNKQMSNMRGKSSKLREGFKSLLPSLGVAGIISGVVAIGKEIFNAAQETFEFRKKIQQLTELSGPQLIDLVAKLQATAKTFSVDLDKLSVANHNFAESMGISEAQANELINKGFIAGADASGEFLDRLREYGPQFKANGISAEEAIAIMTQEVKSGIYSDKGTDAIKEAGIALREMPQTAKDAVDAIGLSSKEMMEQLESGEISVFEAIQKVSRKMGELPPQSSQVGQALADIFKGAGEDAGLDYILMLGEAQTSMDDLIEKSGEAAEANEKMLEANTELAEAWNDMLGAGTGTFKSLWATFKFYLGKMLKALSTFTQGSRLLFSTLFNAMKEGFKGNFEESGRLLANMFDEFKKIKDRFDKEPIEIPIKTAGALKGGKPIAETPEEKKEREKLAAKKLSDEEKLQQSLFEIKKRYGLITQEEIIAEEQRRFLDSDAAKLLSAEQTAKALAEISKKILKLGEVEEPRFDESALEEEHVKEEIDKFKKLQQEKKSIWNAYQLDRADSFDEMADLEVEKLRQLQAAKLISEEEFLVAEKEIRDHFRLLEQEEDDRVRQEKLQKTADYFGALGTLGSAFGTIFTTLQNDELQAVQDKVDKGLISEEEGKKQELAIKKKYADKDFIAKAAQIVSATALGVMQSFAQLGPIAGGILAAVVTAAGAVQLASANKERARVKQLRRGKYGYDVVGEEDGRLYRNVPAKRNIRTGLLRTPTLVAEEPEIVVSTADTASIMQHQPSILNAIRDPQSYNVTPVTQRVNGNLNDVPESTAPAVSTVEQVALQSNAVLNQLATEGIKAVAYYNNEETRKIQDQQDEDAQLLNQTSFATSA